MKDWHASMGFEREGMGLLDPAGSGPKPIAPGKLVGLAKWPTLSLPGFPSRKLLQLLEGDAG